MLKWWRRRNEQADPESDKLWDNFRKAEGCWACKNIEEFHRQHGLAIFFLHDLQADDIRMVTIRHCPACGRRLVFAQ